MKPFLQENSSPPSQELRADTLAELPFSAEYASLILRLWRVPGGEAGMDRTGWRSEVEHIQSGGRWELSSLRELEGFLQDFLRQLGGEEQNKLRRFSDDTGRTQEPDPPGG